MLLCCSGGLLLSGTAFLSIGSRLPWASGLVATAIAHFDISVGSPCPLGGSTPLLGFLGSFGVDPLSFGSLEGQGHVLVNVDGFVLVVGIVVVELVFVDFREIVGIPVGLVAGILVGVIVEIIVGLSRHRGVRVGHDGSLCLELGLGGFLGSYRVWWNGRSAKARWW